MNSRQKNPQDPLELGVMYHGGQAEWLKYREGKTLGPRTANYRDNIQLALTGAPMESTTQSPDNSFPRGGMKTQAPPAQNSGTLQTTRQTTSTSFRSFDPNSLSAALELGTQYITNGGEADTAVSILADSEATRKATQAMQEQSIQTYALDQGAFAVSKAAKAAKDAWQRKDILTQANIDPNATNNLYTKTVQDFNRLTAEAEPLAAEIDARMAVGIYDNPLEYIVNQVRLPGMVGKFNENARVRNRQLEQLTTLQSLANSQQSISAGIDSDTIVEMGRREAAVNASAAQVELTKAQADGARAAALSAANVLGIQGHKVGVALQLANLTAQRESMSESASDKASKTGAEQAEVDRINKWYQLIGRNEVLTPATYKSLSATERTELQRLSGTGIIADDFATGFHAINTRGNKQVLNTAGAMGMTSWIEQTSKLALDRTNAGLGAARQAAKLSGKVLKEDELYDQQLTALKAEYVGQASDMRLAVDSNPLKLQYATISKNPRLAGNAVAEYVNTFGPAGTTPVMAKVDEALVLDKLAADVATGKFTVQQATDQVTGYYKVATDIQAESTKYGLFGILKPKGYVINIPKPGFIASMFGTHEPGASALDLQDSAKVSNYLMRKVAANAKENALPSLWGASGQVTVGAPK
jgi:hypothetical protein